MIRLDKLIAYAAGLTRSQAGKAIRSGSVKVNGSILQKPEQKIDENACSVSLNGETIHFKRYRYFLLNKPTGVITASIDGSQKTVLDLFPHELRKLRLFPVGRLDKDTSGLLLVTNNGEFAHRLISPKSEIDKIYRATVSGSLTDADMMQFRSGLILADGTHCLPAGLTILGESECLVTIREGKYHQVRRMLAAVGKPVLTLQRVSIGPLDISSAPGEGHYRELTDEELCIMFNILHME